ncbi:MAG: efflux RND transporter permease subunit [Pseudomonadota bacterium]
MILSDLSVKRPVFATVISALLVAFGLFALSRLPVREAPDIDPPVVSVSTAYPGASADVVESKVTRIIEDEISGIEGVRTIESTSSDGRSSISIEFTLERDIDGAANDVRDRVSRVIDRLPDEAEAPDISKADADTQPILWLTVSSDTMRPLEMHDYMRRFLVDRLAAVNGVSRVRIGGERRYAMRIWLDRAALALRGLTVDDIERALRQENVELPAGRLESESRDFTVRTARSYLSVDDFRALVVARGGDGSLTRLGEVADVELGAENEKTDFRANGLAAAGLGVIKQSQANTLTVARAVKAEVARIQPTLPDGMRLEVNTDYSVYIEASLREVVRTLLITAGLVILVIYLFIGDMRATLVPAVTVPISLIGSFIALAVLGFSINILTLLALVLAIGLVVDDAIVVLENIYRRVEHGETPLLAAYRGARQVGFAVVATTLVLIAVLVPIALIPGTVGRLFSEFALALAAAVGFSSVVALSLSPAMCAKLLQRRAKSTRISEFNARAFSALKEGYRRLLKAALHRPDAVIIAALIVTASIAVLLTRVPDEFTPREDRGSFFVRMSAPEGASFDYARARQREIEARLMPLVDEGIAARVLSITPGFGGGDDTNSGFSVVTLVDWDARAARVDEVTQRVFRDLSRLPGANAFVLPRPGIGQGRARQPLQVVIGAATYEELRQLRDAMMARLEANPRIFGLDADYQETKPQMRVRIERTRAADLGVSVEVIGRTLETMLGSRRATTFVDRGEEYDVILQAKREDRQTPSDLSNIYVRSSTSGQLVPLSNLVSLTEMAGATSLPRFNRLRAVTISASLAPGYPIGDALAYAEDAARAILPAAARLDFKGEARDLLESSSALYLAFGLSLLVVFLVLAAQFESFIHPLVIMLTVPLAIAAALAALWLGGQSLNIYSKIGIIMLVGLAAKNGILIVEFANQLRDKGLAFEEALVTAAVERLRPILMTALSTVMGAIPLMLASGAGAEARSVLGIVVFSGVLFATLLTLFVVPVFYRLMARHTRSPGAIAGEIETLEARYPRLVEKRHPQPGE